MAEDHAFADHCREESLLSGAPNGTGRTGIILPDSGLIFYSSGFSGEFPLMFSRQDASPRQRLVKYGRCRLPAYTQPFIFANRNDAAEGCKSHPSARSGGLSIPQPL
jgi:hypothetical protein